MIMAGNSAQNSEQEIERERQIGGALEEKRQGHGAERGREVNGRTETANEGNS